MFDATSPSETTGLSAASTPSLQRARGALRLGFALRGGVNTAMQLYQEGALKVRLPRTRGSIPEAVMINTAGGLTGGDAVSVDVTVAEGAAALLTGQACEKLYKSSGGEAEIRSSVTLAPQAALSWLVQPTILFDRARLRRTMHVDMAGDSSFLGLEAIVFGRTAMDEVMAQGFVSDGWRISREGTLIYADTFRISGDIAGVLAKRTVLAGARAMATVIYAAPDAEARLEEMRVVLQDSGDAAASAWNGLLVARFLAPDGYALTRNLTTALTRFRKTPMPRVWMI